MPKDGLHSQVRQNNSTMVRYMITSGANPNEIDERGNLPITYAIAGNDLKMVMTLIEAGADQNATDKLSRTPIHASCIFGRAEILKYLKDHGGNLQKRTGDGQDCLLLAFTSQLELYKSSEEKFKAAKYETVEEVESKYAQVVQFLTENNVRMNKKVFQAKCPDCNLQNLESYKFPTQAEKAIRSIRENMFLK
ncbi:MAG: ankyrin repeat domain-containing protein [Spirochaetes bacterium]|nr:ankyrin repeat domain-containing protein [Spirochaetota bacterium]